MNANLKTNQNLNNYFGNVSYEEFNKAIDDIFQKMDEIIESSKADNKLFSRLKYLKSCFRTQIKIYNLDLSLVKKAKEKLNSLNSKKSICNAKELSTSYLTLYAFGYTIPSQAERFFQLAEVKDNDTQTNIAKIAKFIEEIELDNKKLIRTYSLASENLNSKYAV